MITMREFVNLNISRSILMDLDKTIYKDASQESIKFLLTCHLNNSFVKWF